MKKLFTLIVLLVSLVVSSCMYDDTGIWDKINDHEQRIVTLEELCREMNTNISALQALIEASQNGDYITNVAPITKDGQIIGYTISFAKSEPITIYNGVDGKDGLNGESAPVIGVRQDADGIYYWTIDGEWLTDENGDKVKAEGADGKDGKDGQDGQDGEDGRDGVDGKDGQDGQDGEDGRDGVDGEDGKDGQDGEDGRDGQDGEDGEDGRDGQDGVTPRLKIEDDYWYVSYDDGQTWYLLDRATGDDGDSLFVSVSQDEENVYFILADGTEIVIPKYSGSDEPASENNKIYYTTTDGKKIFPHNGAIDAVLVSNTYEGGQGVMVFDDDITSIRNAFNSEYTLESVVIPASVTEIGYLAFYNCTSLSTVYCKATLPPDAYVYNNQTWMPFDGNAAFRRIYVPEASVSLYRNFSAWSRYASAIKAEGDDSESVVTEIYYTTTDGKPLSLDSSKFDVSITGNVYDNNRDMFVLSFDGELSSILASAFNGKSTLETIIISEGVTSIGYRAFSGCSSLTSVAIPDSVTTIGDSAFIGCVSLTSVNIPDSVTSIGNSAFYNCFSLTSVNIPDGVTSIGDYAFGYCDDLTSVVIPDSVTTIGDSVFSGCSSLTSVAIPDSVTTIGDSAFEDCNGLTSVAIPDSVTSIGDSAFEGCDGLTSVAIPDSVTTIGDYAFSDCDGLASVTIGNSVTTIGNSAFSSCNILTSVTIGNSVTTIGDYAFRYCDDLTSVTIPDSVTSIGRYAFADCTGLTSVTIGNSVTTIGEEAFYRCFNIERVYITDLAAWYNIDFGNSNANPTSQSGCMYIDDNEITKVSIPSTITEIKPYAFYKCGNITSITLHNGITSIGDSAFRGCSNITSVTLREGLISVGEYAFAGTGITEITVPASVAYIDAYAFNSSQLESAKMLSKTPCQLGSTTIGGGIFAPQTFSGQFGSASIYVPAESLDEYKSKWSDWEKRIFPYE